MSYTIAEWQLLFFTYCFLGWVWECCYVSFKKKEWANRGFLNGPLLPIYGTGAIVILWLTLPFQENILFIFILGALGATVLEYGTGAAMEKVFHMRYWDYSHHKYNLKGHVSLFVSLGWGLFSILLIKVLHPPIQQVILQIPTYLIELMSLLLTIIFVIDATLSVKDALDMRKLLKRLTESNKTLSSLELKISDLTSDIKQTSNEFQNYMDQIKKYLHANLLFHQLKMKTQRDSNKIFVFDKLNKGKYMRYHTVEQLGQKVDSMIEGIQLNIDSSSSELETKHLSRVLKILNEVKAGLEKLESNLASIKDKELHRAASFLRRYPTSVSRYFKEALEQIKSLNKENKKK